MNKTSIFNRIWNSPTLMTWLSYSTKALTLFGVLPLVLKLFAPSEVVLWYLFSTIISLQSIADFGFRQTFSRIISYAYGGAADIGVFSKADLENVDNKNPNLKLLSSINSTMNTIYLWLTLIVFILMITLGSWSLAKPIGDAISVSNAWISWVIVLTVSCLGFYGKIYLNFLEGLNKIALVRRVETLTSTGSIITSILVLLTVPSLLNLVIANQVWIVIATGRDWYLCRKIDNSLYLKVSEKLPFDKNIFDKIWQPAWRSGISGFMSVGLTNLTGLIYAQIGNTAGVASYLLALRIINQIKEISMAPFYSKLPIMAMLRVRNDNETLRKIVTRGMLLSHLVFMLGFIAVGLFSSWMLGAIGSEVKFVNQWMWTLLGLAFFMHRFGAMHMQVYLSTNHIISHIADGVSGAIYILVTILLINKVGIYSIPIGMMAGYAGFYSWYSASYSYRSLGTNLWSFERKVILFPTLIFIGYVFYLLFIK